MRKLCAKKKLYIEFGFACVRNRMNKLKITQGHRTTILSSYRAFRGHFRQFYSTLYTIHILIACSFVAFST